MHYFIKIYNQDESLKPAVQVIHIAISDQNNVFDVAQITAFTCSDSQVPPRAITRHEIMDAGNEWSYPNEGEKNVIDICPLKQILNVDRWTHLTLLTTKCWTFIFFPTSFSAWHSTSTGYMTFKQSPRRVLSNNSDLANNIQKTVLALTQYLNK